MISLSKHHGLGNDFLVCDTAQAGPGVPWADLARRWMVDAPAPRQWLAAAPRVTEYF